MSRSLRHKASKAPPARRAAKKTKYTEDTSDDDYSGVDLVSDSEDDDADVRAAEEAAIIESEFEDDDTASAATPRATQDADAEDSDNDHSSWGGFDLESEANSQSLVGTPAASHFFSDAVVDDDIIDSTEPVAAEDQGTPKARRVHFEYSDSSSDDSDVEDDVFPDIFLEQDRLDPSFRKEIENDRSRDNMDNVSDDGSFWDFAGENSGVPLSEAVPKESSYDSSSDDSSDYDCRSRYACHIQFR